uniref:Uncharacterized protein n=1 Tax=Arundo donax TaxID=35708 RepID=A0A0A9B149_ARUDO
MAGKRNGSQERHLQMQLIQAKLLSITSL